MSKNTQNYPETEATLSPAGGIVPALAVAAASGILYWLTSSPGHSPGVPAQAVTRALPDSPLPNVLSPIWGLLVEWTNGSAALLTAFSALCGVLCVFFTAALMARVRHPVHDRNDEDEVHRETQGRILGGITAGLYLAVSMPVWMAATRTMPDLFHLLLVLAPAWMISEYRRAGGTWRLLLLGGLLGVGVAEFPTMWLLAPVAALALSRAMLQRASFRWRDLLMTGAAAALFAVAGFAWGAWRSMRFAVLPFYGIETFWQHLFHFVGQQGRWLGGALRGTGFLLTFFLTVFPWIIIYLFRSKKPAWRHRFPLVVLHLLVLAACLAVVWETPVTAWRVYHLAFLMVTPAAILASCMGFLAADFWIMGQLREHRAAGVGQPLRSLLGLVGLCLPLSLVATAVWHWPAVDSRCAVPLNEAVAAAVGSMPEGGVLMGDGILDDLAVVQGLDRDTPPPAVLVTRLTVEKQYRSFLAARLFTEPRQQALLDLGFAPFLQDGLQSPGERARFAFLNSGEPVRNLGDLVPDGILSRLADAAPSGDALTALVDSQRPFWESVAAIDSAAPAWMQSRAKRDNPVMPFVGYLKLVVSKQIDNTAFWLLDENRSGEAEDLLLLARKISPDNISVLLNLATIARKRGEKDSPYIAEWTAFLAKHRGDRNLWRLAEQFGQVHDTAFLIREGMMWAVSGNPRLAESRLRHTQAGGAHAKLSGDLQAFLGRMYLLGNDIDRGEEYYRDYLAEHPSDVNARHALAKIAIQRGDLDAARAGLEELVAEGISRDAFALEFALIQAAEGDPRGALESLARPNAIRPGEVLPLALMAVLAQYTGDDALFQRAWDNLRDIPSKGLPLRLFLAQLAVNRRDWATARADLDHLCRMNPANPKIWELLVQVDFAERRRDLAENHVRSLLTLDPANAFGNALLASFQRERGQYALAEASYRAAIASRRDPAFLNDLADLLLRRARSEDRPEFLAEATDLVREGLEASPGNLTLVSTRAEIGLEAGRLDEAEADIQTILAHAPDSPFTLLLAADLYIRRGNLAAAGDLLDTLEERTRELPPDAVAQLRSFQERVKKLQSPE